MIECRSLMAPGCPCILPFGHPGLHECLIRRPLRGGREEEWDFLWSDAYIELRDSQGWAAWPNIPMGVA